MQKKKDFDEALKELNYLVRATRLFGKNKGTAEEWADCLKNGSTSKKCRQKQSRIGHMPIFLKAQADSKKEDFDNASQKFLTARDWLINARIYTPGAP